MKECYYSVLGVDKKADDDMIKKAYRQLALRSHPDKQPEEEREAATRGFQIIVEAYECLSNRQERAWYDDHRDQILRGGEAGSEGSTGFSTKNDIWKYFSNSCFNGKFDDSEGGFYRTYSELFEELSSLERDDFDSDVEDHCDDHLPSFGDSRTEWEDVQSFYNQWTNFQSSRHFRGFDKWDLREGENRQVRRAMEAENKKARNSARKEYSAAVRSLVAFVKRRDHRVIEFQAKQAEKVRLETEEKLRQVKEQEELKKAARRVAREVELQRWAEIEQMRQESGELSLDESSSEGEQQDFFCIACRKNFKSEKAFENHENSKKHKQQVEKLREELLMDDLESGEPIEELILDRIEEKVEAEVESVPKSKKKNKKKKPQYGFEDPEEEIPVKAPEIVIEGAPPAPAEEKKGRRRAKNEDSSAPKFACKKCSESFPSKSALFRHLDASGHHALVSQLR